MKEEKEDISEEDLDEPKDIDSELDLEEDNFDNEDDSDYFDDYGMSGGPTPMEKHGDLLKELTNFSPYLKDTVNNWLGLVWSEEEGKYVSSNLIKPIMNIQGAMWCIGFIKTYARSNNIITNLDKVEYIAILEDVIDTVAFNIGTRDDFGVRSTGDMIRIINELFHAVQLVLTGAGDGKYSDLLTRTVSRSESVNLTPQQMNMMGGGMNPVYHSNMKHKTGMVDRFKKLLVGEK